MALGCFQKSNLSISSRASDGPRELRGFRCCIMRLHLSSTSLDNSHRNPSGLSALKSTALSKPSRSLGTSVTLALGCLIWAGANVPTWSQGTPASGGGPQMAIQQLESIKTREQTQALSPSSLSKPAEEETLPQLYPGESQDLGSQKLLRQKPKKSYFEAFADSQFSYTSNALLSDTGPQDAGIWATTLSAAFAPQPFELGPGKLAVRAGYRQLFWIYDIKKENAPSGLNQNNFLFGTVFLSGRYSFLDNWGATLGLDYNRVLTGQAGSDWQWSRLVEFGHWKETYVELTPNWGVDRSFNLSARWSGSLAYSGAYHFSSADPQSAQQSTRRSNDRIDNALMASLMFVPTEQFMIQPFARVLHSAYTRSGAVDPAAGNDSHRRDWTHSFGLNVMWMPTPALAVRATAGGEFRDSSDPIIPDYSKFDTSLGLSVSIRF
jgi:hypothetical protein